MPPWNLEETLVAQAEKNLPAVWETWVQSLHREDTTGPRGPVLCKRSHGKEQPSDHGCRAAPACGKETKPAPSKAENKYINTFLKGPSTM